MGILISTLMDRFFGAQPARIVMLGLDNAGKTTVLYKLKLGEGVTTIPTIGFNVETVVYKNISFTVWDVGGQTKIRLLFINWIKYVFGPKDFYITFYSSVRPSRCTYVYESIHALYDSKLAES